MIRSGTRPGDGATPCRRCRPPYDRNVRGAMLTDRSRPEIACGVAIRNSSRALNRLRAGIVLAERRALVRQPLEQRRRRPAVAELAMERRDAIENLRQTDAVRVEHRPAPKGRKAVAGQVDDVDVGGAQRNAFLEHARAFVDERVDRPLANLVVAQCAGGECRLRRRPLDQGEPLRGREAAFGLHRSVYQPLPVFCPSRPISTSVSATSGLRAPGSSN